MKTIEKIKQKFNVKGSVLVFTLMVMFVLLVSALGIASVAIIERKTSSDTGKSTQSFQVADSGVEIVLQKIYKGNYRTVNDLNIDGGMDCAVEGGKAVISDSIGTGKDFKVTFEDESENPIIACDNDTANIRLIKSVGTFAQTSRAVEVAVAAGCPSGAVTFKVAGNDGKNFPQTQAELIWNFFRGVGYDSPGVLAGMMCDISSTGSSEDSGGGGPRVFSGGIGRLYEDGGEKRFEYYISEGSASDSVKCNEGNSRLCTLEGADCNQGWAVLGFCN